MCFISWIIGGIGFIVDSYLNSKAVLWTFISFPYTTLFCGYSSFTANIIQYNIDQLVGVSADELNSVIYWHILSEPLVQIVDDHYQRYMEQEEQYNRNRYDDIYY